MDEDLQDETAEVLSTLIQYRTVNPPGNERACQEWLADYLSDAGLEVEMDGAEPERPNLVATLKSGDGPTLGYLSHVDTVLADAEDWSTDPWGAERRDGYLYGRGAIDMKDQTAAEAVAAAHLARSGARFDGTLKVISVADEETGGVLGAKWITEERPDLSRVDYLLNEGAGAVMPYGDRRLYGVCVAEKGTFRFNVRTSGTAAHASVPGLADNALLKLAPVITKLGERHPRYDLTEATCALLEALGEDPGAPKRALERVAAISPQLAPLLDAAMSVTFAPTIVSAGEKINVIPARAQVRVDCRVPPGMGSDVALKRAREVLGDDGYELEFTEAVTGNRSPVDSPLMDAISGWIGEHDPGGETVPTVLPAFTDSRWFRAAFPDCVAYGFFPQRHQTVYETWPLMHAADERIDIRDLGFAAAFFHDLPGDSLPVPENKLRLGGMALRNGLLVHGPTHWAAAVRANDGTVKVASGPKPRVTGLDDVPGLRGLARLGEAFAVIPLVKRGLPEAKLAFENPAVLGVAAGASIAGTLVKRRLRGTGGELSAAMLSLAPAVFALRGGELAAYHGVEHKAIAAYEADEADAADADKEHDRCGSHLMAPMLAANLAGTLLLKRAASKPGPLAGGAVALASTAAAVEVFAWSERHADSPISRALKRPGYELQRAFGTREPDERQLEVGRAALAEILRAESK